MDLHICTSMHASFFAYVSRGFRQPWVTSVGTSMCEQAFSAGNICKVNNDNCYSMVRWIVVCMFLPYAMVESCEFSRPSLIWDIYIWRSLWPTYVSPICHLESCDFSRPVKCVGLKYVEYTYSFTYIPAFYRLWEASIYMYVMRIYVCEFSSQLLLTFPG